MICFFGALFNGHHDTRLQDTGASFTPNYTHLWDMLSGLISMHRNDRANLELDIDAEDLEFVVNKCACNKALGLDGLCYEFYKCT